MMFKRKSIFSALMLVVLFMSARTLLGQADQGTVTGLVQDSSGAAIANASVILTNLGTNQTLKTNADSAGEFSFPPVRIGDYSLTASASGFKTTSQNNVHLSVQQRLSIAITLQAGAATETVTVTSEEPLMQTQDSSVGQVMDTQAINNIPLSGRNWLYIAQLSAGAAPPSGSRGQGKGDFTANGTRSEENNFILDGVDNNANTVDFYNGASYVSLPPPDGLSEFKVQTSNYSAEFGHSAGAVINASQKSGTNRIHGSAWDYVRNTSLDAKDWDATVIPPYHENQFGATLGLPIIRNKLFFFGEVQANRIVYSETTTQNVPDAQERAGDFQELLSTSVTGKSPVQLWYQNPNGTSPPVPFVNNCLVTSTYCNSSVTGAVPSSVAMALLKMYPQPSGPNAQAGLLYDNSVVNRPAVDNTFQWDMRLDWNPDSNDALYTHFDYWNEPGNRTPPLGPVLDGGSFGDDGAQILRGENFMISEAHIFSPTLTDEFRFGYNYMSTGTNAPNSGFNNPGFSEQYGVGGVPTTVGNGGLPTVLFTDSGIAHMGAPQWTNTAEHENVFQILDNVTKVIGNQSLRAGVAFQSVRFATYQPIAARGVYSYTGENTSNMQASDTGYSATDFLFDSMNSAELSTAGTVDDARWYSAAYFQDDWRVTPKLTVDLGMRWDYFQPYKEVAGHQASYHMTGPATLDTTTGYGSGSALFQIPNAGAATAQTVFAATNQAWPNVLAKDNISLGYTSNMAILTSQSTNFGPRIGFSYAWDTKTVIRGGYGIFYGGLEMTGFDPNLGMNYPFEMVAQFPAKSCGGTYCPFATNNGVPITLENGTGITAANFESNVENLSLRGSDPQFKTPNTADYNLSVERSITPNKTATIAYVGNSTHHLQINPDPNNPLALENPSNSTQNARALPDFGSTLYTAFAGDANYNALQTKLEQRFSKGLSFLATYTWSKAMDDAVTPLGSNGDAGYRDTTLIPIKMDFSNTPFDTRDRVTFNIGYDLPFGSGRRFANQNGWLNEIVGGWSTDATWEAQTGNYFSVHPNINNTPSGAMTALAVETKNPFASGGTFVDPDPAIAASVSCPAKVRNHNNWYNPCSFINPWNPNDPAYSPSHYIPKSATDPNITSSSQPVYVQSLASAIGFLGGRRDEIVGPGYERVNFSLFKDFKVYGRQVLTFRADIFNLFNTPSLDEPSSTAPNSSIGATGGDDTIDSTGGKITSPRLFQNLTPDARFVQLSLKYAF